MTTIVCIVEGDGEVTAVPVLLRRIAESLGSYDVVLPRPIRVHRDRFIRRDDEFSRTIQLAAAKAQGGAVLVIVDADDDCPVALAADLSQRARAVREDLPIAVVIAQREFESWFLAAAPSLEGRRGLSGDLHPPPDCDAVRDAKGWLSRRIAGGRYHEVTDQPALSAVFDLVQAQLHSRSFRKLYKECAAILRLAHP